MDGLFDVLSWILLLGGGFFSVSGAIGLLRFPDFFTRIHAAGVTDTMGAGMILTGLMLQAPDPIALMKLVFILAFALLTSPTATHALAKSALKGGLSMEKSTAVADRSAPSNS
ncbi:MAG: monovalent cation/H(+) antiporter subunit G [Pseudomonadales bacterium]|nr:monovalent cation/H(+) antiporter subunit G [Pseudomonadales bacterium]